MESGLKTCFDGSPLHSRMLAGNAGLCSDRCTGGDLVFSFQFSVFSWPLAVRSGGSVEAGQNLLSLGVVTPLAAAADFGLCGGLTVRDSRLRFWGRVAPLPPTALPLTGARGGLVCSFQL